MVTKRLNRRNGKKSRGQSLVEFALILPLLLALIITAIELGRLFYTQIVITNAAREGAYYVATHVAAADASDKDLYDRAAVVSEATAAAEAEASNSGVQAIAVNFIPTSDSWQSDHEVLVTVETTVTDVMIVSLLGNIFSITTSNNSFDLSASVEMMVQP